MAGFFNGLLGGGTTPLLGGDNLVPWSQDPVVTSVGMSLLNGKDMSGRYDFSNVGPAMLTKGLMQTKAEDRKKADDRRLAMGEFLKAYPGLSPEERVYYGMNPDAFDPMKFREGGKDNLMVAGGNIYDTRSGEWIESPEGAGGAYEGSGMDQQNWNIALEAVRSGNFDTPEYEAAYAQLTQPKTQMVMTDNGYLPVQVPPNVPGWLRAPTRVNTPTQTGAVDGQAIPGTQRNTESIRTETTRAEQAYKAIDEELSRYVELVKKSGVELLPGAQKDQLTSVRQGIMLQLKELFNLGVLNGPDLTLMENMIYDPSISPLKEGGIAALPDQLLTAAGEVTGLGGGAGARAESSANELRRMLKNIVESKRRGASGAAPQPPPQQSMEDDPLGIR